MYVYIYIYPSLYNIHIYIYIYYIYIYIYIYIYYTHIRQAVCERLAAAGSRKGERSTSEPSSTPLFRLVVLLFDCLSSLFVYFSRALRLPRMKLVIMLLLIGVHTIVFCW